MINIEKLMKNGTKYLMDSEFQRIRDGERLGINKQPYSLRLYDNLIKYYEESEEYEKCVEILKEKNKILDHDKNYKWIEN
jgi:transcription elongation factor GreA-like protein